MDTTKTLQEAYRMVWNFRKMSEGRWPTPTPRDSALYAVTEIAEAIDARLRLENPDHVRNNERNEDVLAELADAAIMLLTALGPDYKFNHHICGPALGPVTLERVMQLACSCFGNSAKVHTTDIQYLLGIISQYPGMDLLPEIEGGLIKLERKLNAVKVIDEWMSEPSYVGDDLATIRLEDINWVICEGKILTINRNHGSVVLEYPSEVECRRMHRTIQNALLTT